MPSRFRKPSSKSPSTIKATPPKDPYYLRAVGKALEAQEILQRSDKPLSLGEMTSRLRLTKTSAYRILHTLEISKCVRRSAEGAYVLSENGTVAGLSPPLVDRLIQQSAEPLRNLVRQFRETVGLAALFGNHIEVVSVVESPEEVRTGNTVGRILPPHASALGKCVTAFQNEDRRERLLRSYGIVRITPRTITDEVDLNREFNEIVRRGYAIDEEESALHSFCLAAPVRSGDGDVFGAVSVSVPISRLPQRDTKRIIAFMLSAAEKIAKSVQRD